MKNKTQRITSYVSGYGLSVYEIEEYDSESDDWYIVGDSSTDKNWIITQIEKHNQKIDTEQEAAQNLAEQALHAKKQSTALLLALAAHSLNPDVDTESIMAQWLEKWLQENQNRKGANYE